MRDVINSNHRNEGQHGSLSGKSTQMQLLMHHQSIYETLMQEWRMVEINKTLQPRKKEKDT